MNNLKEDGNIGTPFKEPLYTIIFIFAVIAFIVGGGIIVLSFFTKNKISYTFALILNLIFSAMIHTIGYTLNWVYDTKSGSLVSYFSSSLCEAQSFTLIASSMSEELWVTIVTIESYLLTSSSQGEGEGTATIKWKKILLLCLLTYLFPAIVTYVYFHFDLLGKNHLNCWIKSEEKMYLWGLILYCHKWVNIVLVIYFSFLMLRTLLSITIKDEKEKESAKKYLITILIFPTIQLIGGIIPTIYTILIGFEINIDNNFFGVATLLCGAIQGVLFPIVYLSFTNVRQGLLFCCYKKEHVSQKNDLDNSFDTEKEDEGEKSFDSNNILVAGRASE